MTIKEAWRENLNFDQSKIELVPVSWLWNYRGTNPSKLIELGDKEVDLKGLWEAVLANGLHAPLIMRVGTKNKKFRLETGNHLIQLFREHNIEKVPVTVQIREECGPEAKDVMTTATHNFDWNDEISFSAPLTEYMKPSDVFRRISD
jgi:hypothetical protein